MSCSGYQDTVVGIHFPNHYLVMVRRDAVTNMGRDRQWISHSVGHQWSAWGLLVNDNSSSSQRSVCLCCNFHSHGTIGS